MKTSKQMDFHQQNTRAKGRPIQETVKSIWGQGNCLRTIRCLLKCGILILRETDPEASKTGPSQQRQPQNLDYTRSTLFVEKPAIDCFKSIKILRSALWQSTAPMAMMINPVPISPHRSLGSSMGGVGEELIEMVSHIGLFSIGVWFPKWHV